MLSATPPVEEDRFADDYLRDRGFPAAVISEVGWRVEPLGPSCRTYGLPAEAATMPVWVIPYRHRNGGVAFERIRLIGPDDVERYGGKYRQPAGRPLALYDPYGVLTLDEPLDSIILVEGEANAVAVHTVLPELAVIGLPGQRALTSKMAEQLAHVPVVFVWLDMHDEGAATTADAIASKLRDAGVNEVRLLPAAAGMDANDCLRELGPERAASAVSSLLDQAEAAPELGDEAWPLLPQAALPDFPLDALPPAVAQFVRELASATETPADLGAVTALGVLSVAGLGARVECGPEWEEELSLYLLVAMESGDRKSSVLGAVARPLHILEREARERSASVIREKHLRRETLEVRKTKLIRKMEDMANPAQRADTEAELAAVAEELERIGEPVSPRLLADDATAETLGGLLAKYERLAIVTAEAPLIANLLGRYAADGAANLDLVCKAYEGERTQVDRRNREELLERPLLTVMLTVQPHVLRRLVEHEVARQQGLVGRFAFAIPESLLGTRRHLDGEVSREGRQAWEDIVRRVYTRRALTEPTETVSVGSVSPQEIGDLRLLLSSPARGLLRELRIAQEPRLREGGDLRVISDWQARHAGRVARIAALLHLADARVDARIIDEETMRRALRIGEYFLSHGRAVLTEPDALIRRALRWLERHQDVKVTIRELQRGPLGGGATADRARELADSLVKIGALRPVSDTTGSERSRGRPSSPAYDINPRLRGLQ